MIASQTAGVPLETGEFLLGVVLLALAVGCAVGFAALVARRRLPELTGSPRLLAITVLATLGFLGVHLVPAALGLLGRGSVAVCSLILLAAAFFISPRAQGNRLPAFPLGPSSSRLSRLLAGAGLIVLGVYLLAHAAADTDVATRNVDMSTFHLPNVARWIQTGSFWQVDDFVPHRAFGTYPNTGDVLLLGVVIPFRNDFLVPLVNYPILGVIGLSTYVLARELRAAAAPAVLFAAAFAAMPVVIQPVLDGYSDPLMLAGFGAGLAFMTRWRRTAAGSDLVLAGLALGLSFGTKWYAPPAVAFLVAGWAVAELLRRAPLRLLLRGTALLSGLVAAAGGFWLLRNLVETGDPLFPVEVTVAGITVFDAPRDIHREMFGFTLAGYFDDPGVLRHTIWPSFLTYMSWVAVLLWAMFPVAGVLAWLRRRLPEERDQVLWILVLVGVSAAIAVLYVITPYTALGLAGDPVLGAVNARYVVPSLLIGAALAAWSTSRLGTVGLVVEGLGLLTLVDGVRRNVHASAPALAAAAVLLGAGAGAFWLARRRRLELPSWRSPLAAAGVAVVAALVVGGVYAQQERFNDTRYADADATARWINSNAASGRRIGVVGEGFYVYTMFGPRLRNRVEYVGPVKQGMLRTYGRRPEFAAALRKGRYDLVLLQDAGLVEPSLPKRHERWIRAMGYRLVARGRQPTSQGARLYRAPG